MIRKASRTQASSSDDAETESKIPDTAGSTFTSDKVIQVIGLCSVLAGAVAYFCGASITSNYLIAGGMLMYIAVKIAAWWDRR
jgi:hypothetical protein